MFQIVSNPLLSMSSIPTSGPCSVCGEHGYKKCSTCSKLYCSKACQKQDWPTHKTVCNPDDWSSSSTARPTESDIDRAVRKATGKLDHFNQQVRDVQGGRGEGPSIRFTTHPGLPQYQSPEWLAAMDGWLTAAKAEVLRCIADDSIRFHVSRIGSVLTEAVVIGKTTGIVLYADGRSQSNIWTICLEPLAHNRDEAF